MRISDWSSDVCSSDLHWRSVLALTPQDNQVFLREVDDALRQDRLASFGMRYGIWLLALIVLTLVAFGGWLWWNHQAEQKAGERSEQLSKTLRSEEHTSELQSLMRISYAVLCLKKKNKKRTSK